MVRKRLVCELMGVMIVGGDAGRNPYRPESFFAGSIVARPEIRREIFYWGAGKWGVLPADLSFAYGEGEECPLFFDGGCGGGSGFSAVPALPAGVLAGDACVERHAKYGFAGAEIDCGERA